MRQGTTVLIMIAVTGAFVASATGRKQDQSPQQADLTADTSVASPAHVDGTPVVLIDEAHANFHTVTGRYAPFAALLRADGCDVRPLTKPFSEEALADAHVLVIANASPDEAGGSRFGPAECAALDTWVRGGGSLFLIADHAPFGAASLNLAAMFGVEMRNCYTYDADHAAEPGRTTFIAYDRDDNRLADHPITRGRDARERISRVVTFTGQSLKGPHDAAVIMSLSDGAEDRVHDPATGEVLGTVSAAGRSQLVAFRRGAGRIVVSAEAAMFSAQTLPGDGPAQQRAMGFHRPGSDNKQLTLNIVRWLTGVLEPEERDHNERRER